MIAYLILHYKNIEETKACMDSLLAHASKDSVFVIVENGSKDGSVQKLQALYQDNGRVHLVLLDENVGFSKGNNAGWAYIQAHFNPDFVVIGNNDLIFNQPDFEKRIEAIHQRRPFDLLGPDIYLPRYKNHQNPLFTHDITLQEVKEKLAMYERYQKNPQQFYYRFRAHHFKDALCARSSLFFKLYAKVRRVDFTNYRQEQENVVLQGACLICARSFIEKEAKVFEPEPFLYCEEIFLHLKCRQKGYKTLYCPDLKVDHMEGASFAKAHKNQKEKMTFILKQHVDAHRMVADYMERNSL